MDILCPGKTVTRYLYSDFKYRTVFLVQTLTFNNLFDIKPKSDTLLCEL
jgi:hypothetical protein